MKTPVQRPNLTFAVCLLIFLGMNLNSFAQASKDYGESVSHTAKSKNLQWADCPPLMPAGCQIAVLNGELGKPNIDIFFKVPPNYDIPNHYHTSPERMVLVSGELHVTYEDEKTTVMKAGTYAYGPSQKPHVAKCQGGDPCIIFIAFEEPLDAFPFETN